MSKKSRTIKVTLSEEEYEKLRKLAEEQGYSLSAFVRSLIRQYLGIAESELDISTISSKIKELESRYDQLAKEVARIEKDIIMILKRLERLSKYVSRAST